MGFEVKVIRAGRKGAEIDAGPCRGLHWFAIFVAASTVVLLLAGALVTSNEAGDSVPDWPLSFGRWIISSQHFAANVRFEYSHRVIAGCVGIATLILAVWTWLVERRRWMRRLAVAAFAGVVLQAVIGGVRVHFPEYKPQIAIPHALVAQSFLAVIVSLAVFTSRSWSHRREARADSEGLPLRRLAALTVAAVLVQLVLGAGFRHQAFGIIPHVVGAVAVTVMIVWTSTTVLRRHGGEAFLRRPALTALVLLAFQLILGVTAYIARLQSADDPQPLEPMISLTVAHLVVGALTLATIVVLTLRTYRALTPAGRRARGAAGASDLARDAGRATA
jgi:heme A synthase